MVYECKTAPLKYHNKTFIFLSLIAYKCRFHQLTVCLIGAIFAVRVGVTDPRVVNALSRGPAAELSVEMALVIGNDVMWRAVHLVRPIGTVVAAVAVPSQRDTLRAVALPLVRRARHRR